MPYTNDNYDEDKDANNDNNTDANDANARLWR